MEYQNKVEMIEKIIRQGEKGDSKLLIGMEFEHIVVWEDTFESVNYYEEAGIQAILNKMLEKGFDAKYEKDYLVGLEMEYGVITLEPGGQLELSIKPAAELCQVESLYQAFLEDVLPLLKENKQLLMAIGYHPKTSIKDIPFNPKKRYEYMSNYFKKTGKFAHNMMKGTAALQVAIDYRDEKDFIKKYRVASFLAPALALISDNSPVFEGTLYDKNSIRSVIWQNTDIDRSGIVKGVMKQSFGYREYAEYLLGVPPIFITHEGQYIPTNERTVSEILDQYQLTEEELEHLFTMIFPDVRVKRYIEIRMGDALPYPLNLAYGALIKGIFYQPKAVDYLYEISLKVTNEDLEGYKEAMIEKGFEAEFMGRPLGELIMKLFDMAESGLEKEEIDYLYPLKTMILGGKNPAMISKECFLVEGIKTLGWCGLNDRVRGSKDNASREVI